VAHQLSIASFNAENFYLLTDRDYGRDEFDALDEAEYHGMNVSIYNPNKARAKIAEIARIILEWDFDVVGMCEVGGLETLENFNRLYLDGRYECRAYEENSSRGIYVGALLKKGRFPGFRASNVRGDFSRNILRLDLGREGGGLRVFVVHLKSQRGDDRGIEYRLAEVARLSSLVRKRKCIVMGDFNGVLIRGMHQFEFEEFLELPLCDVLAAVGVPPAQRRTHYYFGDGARFSQLDYIFCTHDIEVLEGEALEDLVPHTRSERERLPSDHLFIRALIR
jgi:endonuclease/exonuclease/phosphatase family metal-dependent hydrolase